MMRFRRNKAESAVATVPPTPTVGPDTAATSPATTVTVTIERDKPQSKVQVVIRDEQADLREHRDLPDVHPMDREFFQKFHRGKPDLKYEFWVRKRFPFWPPQPSVASGGTSPIHGGRKPT